MTSHNSSEITPVRNTQRSSNEPSETIRRHALGNPERPSGPDSRPYGLRFAHTAPQVMESKHAKKPTRKSRTTRTKQSGDGQTNDSYKDDTEHYVEMDQV